jgi:hypothetical protein
MALLLALGSVTAWAGPVLGPGQEERVLAMLQRALDDAPACTLSAVSIDEATISASFACGESSAPLVFQLMPAIVPGESLAVTSPEGAPLALTAGVKRAARAGHASLVWTTGGRPPATRAPEDAAREHARALALAEGGDLARALEALVALLSEHPESAEAQRSLALVTAKSTRDSWSWRELAEQADRAPADSGLSFAAGVAAYYGARYGADTPSTKAALYGEARRLLARAASGLAPERTAPLLLALSAFRTGDGAAARESIEAAAALAPDDLEVKLARAEILHRTDPDRALADLVAGAAELRRRGVPDDDGEYPLAHVDNLRDYVERVARGDLHAAAVFDPLPLAATRAAPRRPVTEPSSRALQVVFFLVALAYGLDAVLRTWRRRRPRTIR